MSILRRQLSPILGALGRGGPSFTFEIRGLLRVTKFFAIWCIMVMMLLWWKGALDDLMGAGEVISLQRFSVRLTPKQPSIEIARRDLGQKAGPTSAEERRHILLRLDPANGTVFIRNVAQTRKLLLTFQRLETPAERMIIPLGQVSHLYVGGGALTFNDVTPNAFGLTVAAGDDPPRRFHYDAASGANLEAVGSRAWSADCAMPDPIPKLRAELNALRHRVAGWWSTRAGGIWRPTDDVEIATLGGRTDCAYSDRRQIGQVGTLPWRELRILRLGAAFMIAPVKTAERNKRPVAFVSGLNNAPESTGMRKSFAEIDWPINDERGPYGSLVSLIAGSTTYRVILSCVETRGASGFCPPKSAATVSFVPTRNISVFDPAECANVAKSEQSKCLFNRGSQQRPCSGASMPCWTWSLPHNVLAAGAGTSAIAGLSRFEEALRLGVVAAGLATSAWMTGFFSITAWRVTRHKRRPITWVSLSLTAVSGFLALLPEILGAFGVPLKGQEAFDLTLLNWLLAGGAMLWNTNTLGPGILWLTLIVMSAIGSTTLAGMALDGDTTKWSLYVIRHKYLFLDLVPPLIIGVVSPTARAIDPLLRELVFKTNHKYWPVRYFPALLLTVIFALWLFQGNQTGFGGGVQPAEAGKFASVLLAAAILTRFDPDNHVTDPPRGVFSLVSGMVGFVFLAGILFSATPSGWWFKLAAILLTAYSLALAFLPAALRGIAMAISALAVFFGFLILVPVARSDWSPALIMTLLMAGMLGLFIVPIALRQMAYAWSRQSERDRAPFAFFPRWRRGFMGPARFACLLLVLTIGALALSPMIVAKAGTWILKLPSWGTTVEQRLFDLENQSMGKGRRVVAERFITWFDLDFSKPHWPNCKGPDLATDDASSSEEATPRVCYRDIEWQVIRARRVVAQAPCGIAPPLDPKSWPGLGAAFNLIASAVSPGVCGLQGTAASPEFRADIVKPITIPVVDSDFAAAYLVGRFGLGAAVLFFTAQAVFIGVAIWAFVLLSMKASGSRTDVALQRFLAAAVAGSGLLFLLQWCFSWSNMLGLLPVMGQPMTFLSYAVSHDVFMALPCLIVLVIGLRFASSRQIILTPNGVPRSGAFERSRAK